MRFTLTLNLLLAATALAARVKPVEKRNVEIFRNDVEHGVCKPITVVFARGTIEPGNVGTLTGPPFFDALEKALGKQNLAIQGIGKYLANIHGFLGGGSDWGAAYMAQIAAKAVEQCPDTQLVLSGYSQGAQVTHKASVRLSTELMDKVVAIVVFGDPDRGTPFPGPLNATAKTFCHEGDLICEGTAIVLPTHFDYYEDAPAAAAFVKERLSK